MKKFLNNLKIYQKINITFLISAIMVFFIIIVFLSVSNDTIKQLNQNQKWQYNIYKQSKNIRDGLRKIDYMAIENAIGTIKDYDKKSQKVYKKILNAIDNLSEDNRLHNKKEILSLLKKLRERIMGYKKINDLLKSEIKEDIEDGMYAMLALAKTGGIIANELNILEKKLDKVILTEKTKLNKHLLHIKITALSIVFLIFMVMYNINHFVSNNIIKKLKLLQKEVVSFFDFLSKKSNNVMHVEIDSKDEIAEISKIIDENIKLAEEILEKERREAEIIEQEVKKATKEIRELNKELEATQREVVFTMGSIAEERSKETGLHVQRVAEYSLILARLAGLSLEESILIKDASPMHDIGKIGIPESILHKPGKLTEEEFERMKKHCEIGYKLLCHSTRAILKAASIVAYEHHEKWNGKGYPRGLKGEEIHIYGRITAIADVFDALGSDRSYKKAWPIEKIVKLFEEERGKHFDPRLTDIFLDNLEHFLAAKFNIESQDKEHRLTNFIEDYSRVDKYIHI